VIRAIERRDAPRQTTPINQAWAQVLQWPGTRMVHVRVVNISVYGALVRIEGPFLVSGPIRIRLADAPETGWLEADAVRCEGSHEVAIRFASP
jgi:hypothetical protein